MKPKQTFSVGDLVVVPTRGIVKKVDKDRILVDIIGLMRPGDLLSVNPKKAKILQKNRITKESLRQ